MQLFLSRGLLAEGLGQRLSELKSQIGRVQDKAYSYVVRTLDLEGQTFQQYASAPNFQGDVLTLCTCKHQMRASRSAEDWQGVWIAGFTSRTIHHGRHWLFYLAQIEIAYESHADLWHGMRAASRNAKAAHRHFLGDVFRPKTPLPTGNARFTPSRYVSPTHHSHRWRDADGWHNGWYNDIKYCNAEKYGNPALLVADPRRTFLWDVPRIYFDDDHCRNYYKWSSLPELISHLR